MKKASVKKILSIAGIAVIAVVLIIGNIICGLYKNIITQYVCGFGVDDNSEEAVAARASGNVLAAQVEEEGAVLLKNDGVLPLENDKVNVFGAGAYTCFIPQGTGSGTGSRNDYVDFLGGLKEAGIEYNPSLAQEYLALNYSHVEYKQGNYVIEATGEEEYKAIYGVIEAGADFYTDSRMNSAKDYSDTAVVVLGRLLGEGNDYSKMQYVQNDANDETRKLQSVSAREEAMLNAVCKHFSKVVVVLNTTNPMELGFADGDGIGAVVWMGTPGTRGSIGLANLLKGKVSPSGHLTDTWAYDLSTAASYATSGKEGVNTYTDIKSGSTSLGVRENKYSDYLEDIYVGYKWYETADAEGFWDSAYAKNKWRINNGYEDVVQFPFGFGLSYTEFKWTVTDCNLKDGAIMPKDGVIEFTVRVENVGERAGKDVVQVYYTPPYTKGGIEKSAVNLGAFAKTAELQPGQVETLTVKLPVADIKCYDCYDRNNNGFMGYELEGGRYTVSFRTDAHTLAVTGNANGKNSYEFTVPSDGYKYDKDGVTGETVTNQFTTYTNTVSGASSVINELAVSGAHSIDGGDEEYKITYLTRADFAGTFPEERPADRAAGTALINDTLYTGKFVNNDAATERPIFGSKATHWTISDLFSVDHDDYMWDEIVSQLTLAECAKLVVQGGFGTIGIDSVNLTATRAGDGPSGFNNSVTGKGDLKAVNYPSATVIASTWDWYMAYQVGKAIGIEGMALGDSSKGTLPISGWYGPGANLHRSPLGGRNFEYYSEDARLTGIMAAYEVYGAKEQGVTAYVKHIAVNDCESGRGAAYKWLTEQNLRENYLLPFELIVKVGKGNAMMSSVDRVGSVRASSSYAMLTGVLRNEWGFRGTVITDYYQCSKPSGGAGNDGADITHDVDECVRAGNSMLLWTDGDIRFFNDSRSVTAQRAIYESAKDIMYTYADTRNFAEVSQGLTKGSLVGESVSVFAWWIILLVVADVVIAAALVLWGIWAFAPRLLKRKKFPSVETSENNGG